MKTLAFFILLCVGLSFSFQAESQTVTITDNEMTFTVGNETFYSTRSKTIILPSGFMVKTASFQLPKDNYLVPDKGTHIIGVRYVISYLTDEYGNFILDDKGNKIPDEFLTDEKVDINHNGKFNVSMHINGAGHFLPLGWYDPSSYE